MTLASDVDAHASRQPRVHRLRDRDLDAARKAHDHLPGRLRLVEERFCATWPPMAPAMVPAAIATSRPVPAPIRLPRPAPATPPMIAPHPSLLVLLQYPEVEQATEDKLHCKGDLQHAQHRAEDLQRQDCDAPHDPAGIQHHQQVEA